MSSMLSNSSTNEHIIAIESAFDRADSPVRWLVITHHDLRLISKLSTALMGQSAAMLQISQDAWDFKRMEFVETVEWALLQGEVENLVLLGTSQAVGSSMRIGLTDSKMGSGYDAGEGKLVTKVMQNIDRTRRALDVFSDHLQNLMQIPVVNSAWRDGELNVYGLFYRAESGSFLRYDADLDGFQPLSPDRNLDNKTTAI
ncbi:MAG: hypothetical protein R3C02_05180 [Planctomycetaceae bacterium]